MKPNPLDPSEQSELVLAVHEVGHALVAHLYNFVIHRVAIVMHEVEIGDPRMVKNFCHAVIDDGTKVQKRNYFAGGAAAEQLCFEGRNRELGARDDLRKHVQIGGGNWERDVKAVRGLRGFCGNRSR